MTGCGCKICKSNLGNFTNNLVSGGVSLQTTLEELKSRDCEVSLKLLKKHLSAFDIKYQETLEPLSYQGLEPVDVVLDDVDFTEYNFDINDFESTVSYLQKLNLKIYLNQLKIVMQHQNDVLQGKSSSISVDDFRALEIAQKNLEKMTGIDITINQQKAIKVCESMGLEVSKPVYLPQSNNVQSNTNNEADS